MSTSFPLVQYAIETNGNSITLGSSTAGDMMVLIWAAGTSFGGSPTPPASVTDNNGNTYSLLSGSFPGQPPQSTLAIYVAWDIVVTPHNPITITVSGATGVPAGGPSLIALEFGVPAAYEIYGASCSGTAGTSGANVDFDLGIAAGIGTGPQTFTLTGGSSPAQVAILLVNQAGGGDMLAVTANYYHSSSTVTWTTNGSLITQTAESQSGTSGRSAAAATLAVAFSSMVCGYVAPELAITCNNPPQGTEGVPYSHQFGPATGGTPPYTYSLTGSVPGLTFNDATGVLSGTPTTPGTYSLTVGVTDSVPDTADVMCSVVIVAPSTPTASCNTPPNGTVGIAYTHQFTATGGTPPYTFAITVGALPPGLTMNNVGKVTGTPTTAGTYPFTVQVTDANGNTNAVNCSITIVNPTPSPTDTQFFLTHVVVGLKVARLPVRGSAT